MAGKNSIWPWVGIVGGGALLYHLQGLNDVRENLKIRLTNAVPQRPSGGKVVTRVSFEAANPGRQNVRLDFIDAEIRLGNILLGTLNENAFARLRQTRPEYGVIQARSRSILSFDVSTPIGETALALLMGFFSGGLSQTITITGFAMAEGIRFPINYSQKVSLGNG